MRQNKVKQHGRLKSLRLIA